MLLIFFVFRPQGSDLISSSKNWPSVWVKMVSSWVCVFVYIVTLFVPRCIPGRDLSYIEGVEDYGSKPRRHGGTLV